MILVRLRHEGGGIYRYGEPGHPVGRLRLDPKTGWPERLESVDLGLNPDPHITAGAAIWWHWRQYRDLPEVLEVDRPPCEPVSKAAKTEHPTPVRQGRLRQVSGRPMSVAEIARRSHGASTDPR